MFSIDRQTCSFVRIAPIASFTEVRRFTLTRPRKYKYISTGEKQAQRGRWKNKKIGVLYTDLFFAAHTGGGPGCGQRFHARSRSPNAGPPARCSAYASSSINGESACGRLRPGARHQKSRKYRRGTNAHLLPSRASTSQHLFVPDLRCCHPTLAVEQFSSQER
jgi:hypothetical protein